MTTSEISVAADARNISNSEVTTWLTCQQLYYFQFVQKLEKIPTGQSALGVGIATHDALKAYNRARIAGADHVEALRVMDQALMSMAGGRAHMDDIYQAKLLCKMYHDNYGDELSQYEIIQAEDKLVLPLTDDFTMPLTFDWYGVHKPTGRYVLRDYKTTYDWWTPHRKQLSPQFAKYFAAFRVNGMRVDECQLDMIRTRWKKVTERSYEDLHKRETILPKVGKIENTLKQHIRASQRITNYRSLSPQAQEENALPCLNWAVCKMCDFKELCGAKLEGQDPVSIRLITQTEYRQNTYDYNKTDEIKGLL